MESPKIEHTERVSTTAERCKDIALELKGIGRQWSKRDEAQIQTSPPRSRKVTWYGDHSYSRVSHAESQTDHQVRSDDPCSGECSLCGQVSEKLYFVHSNFTWMDGVKSALQCAGCEVEFVKMTPDEDNLPCDEVMDCTLLEVHYEDSDGGDNVADDSDITKDSGDALSSVQQETESEVGFRPVNDHVGSHLKSAHRGIDVKIEHVDEGRAGENVGFKDFEITFDNESNSGFGDAVQRPTECSCCGMTFDSYRDYTSHLTRDMQNAVLTCKICMKQCESLRALSTHMTIHGVLEDKLPSKQQTRGTTPGSCYLSVFRNETGSKLRKEIDELDPSSCGNLNEAGSQLSQADAPVSPSQDDSSQLGIGPENNDDGRTKGEESAGKKVGANRRGSRQRAHSTTPRGAKKVHKCAHCGFNCVSRTQLKRHVLKHTGVLPYQCVKCGLRFACPRTLKIHFMVHTGIRPYKCDICGKGYRTASNLRIHTVRHGSVQPFTCVVCGKGFARNYDLEMHIVSCHPEQDTFQCSRCPKVYASEASLQLHERYHRNQHIFPCSVCGKEFRSKSSRTKHLMTHFTDSSQQVSDLHQATSV